jgi:hypothetical protein
MKQPITFLTRIAPLVPECVVAVGPSSRLLAARVLEREDESLSALEGLATEDAILLFGEANVLPWIDGVSYLGRDPRAPLLYLPTTLEPDMPIELFERAIVKQEGAVSFAVLVSPPLLIPTHERASVDRAALRAWLERHT